MVSIEDIVRCRRNEISRQMLVGTMHLPLSNPIVQETAITTHLFNEEFKRGFERLNYYRELYAQHTETYLKTNPNFTYDRNKAVGLAWEYEDFDIRMGGRGSAHWTKAEQIEISRRGTLHGAEAHHAKNVANFPSEQSNPDNIIFYRSKSEHLNMGHNGDFHNESNKPFIDRNKMIRRTNLRRVVKNEVIGAGLTALITFVSSASINFIIEMAKSKHDPDRVKQAFQTSLSVGMEGTLMALTSYGIARLTQPTLTNLIIKALTKYGFDVGNVGIFCIGEGITAIIAIAVSSIWMYIRMRNQGYSSKDAGKFVLKQSGVSLVIMSIAIAISAKWGKGPAIWFTLAICAGALLYGVITEKKAQLFEKRLQEKIIYLLEPYIIA